MVTNFANSSHSAALRATLTWTPKSLPVLRRILTDQPDILTQRDAQGNTILHFLAAGGNATAFRELFEGGLLTRSNGGGGGDLRTWNGRGDTVLHEAARFGRVNVVEILIERERELVSECNAMGETPLYSAAANGEREVFHLLKAAAAREEMQRRDDGCTVLHAAIMGEHYSTFFFFFFPLSFLQYCHVFLDCLAMEIVESFPNLAGALDKNGNTALNMLATKPVSFKSGSNYWLRNLGSRPSISLQFLLCLVYLCMPMWINESKLTEDVEDPQRNKPVICQSIGSFVENIISVVPWLRAVHDVKKKHACALKLAKTLIAKEEDWSHYTNSCGRRNPLLQAAENSILELVKEILGKFPEAAYCFDSNGKNIFHIAVENKDCTMYSFLKKNVARKDWMMAALDHDKNSILHLAAKDGAHPRVLFGSLNRMIWNVYWFKLVCYDSPPHLLWYPNSGGKTATELFEDTHSSLQNDAKKALKSMNDGMFVVSALFGTVNYAAVFTLPGGFDTDRDSGRSGFPALYGTDKQQELLLFLFYTSVALLAALFSLVEMVAIQLSKFTSSDFFMALPYRYIAAYSILDLFDQKVCRWYTAAITTLYVAVVSTTAACTKAYDIIDIDTSIPDFPFVVPAVVAVTIVYVDVVYLPLCGLCLALRCSLTYRGHMFEASAIFKRSIEEAVRDADQKKQEKEKVIHD
ncbi:hypothetical protein RHSIM_Rhsim05G0189100 [Rhododendron simsii]|uniref:PGG domain-containing protein n=1 Tax=Rhododendron simsii TaxID=118357 RepID=A0A834LL30_RHOSS|nr:hypothetical protein RHSIM_Rhsim05G0189100 [Rhododendron simsii]